MIMRGAQRGFFSEIKDGNGGQQLQKWYWLSNSKKIYLFLTGRLQAPLIFKRQMKMQQSVCRADAKKRWSEKECGMH